MTETQVSPPKWGGSTADWLAWARTLDPTVPDDAKRAELRETFGDQWRATQDKTKQVVLVPADHLAASVTFGYDGDEYVVTRAPGYSADPDAAAELLEAAAAAGVLIKIQEA
jgi:hypothetical protein